MKRRQAIAIALLGCLVLALAWFDGHSSQVAAPPKPAERTEQPNKKGYKDSYFYELWLWATHDAITVYTFFLALFTAVLSGTAFVQIRYLIRADYLARRSSIAARRAANASIRQAKIAEAALTQLERPYIFIFGIGAAARDDETGRFFVEYTVANYGKMPAIIEAPHIGFEIDNGGQPPIPTLVADDHALLVSPILQSGEVRTGFREYFPPQMVGENIAFRQVPAAEGFTLVAFPDLQAPAGFDIFFRAVIRYRGPVSRGHETSALWLVNYPSEGQLAQRGGDEYNYVN